MAVKTKSKSPAPQYDPYPFDLMALARLLVIGFVVGMLGWLLYLGIAQFIIEQIFCRNADSFGVCRNGGTVAWAAAQVVVMIAALAALARLAVYRPLFIILGVFIALWSAHAWLGVLPWWGAMLWHGALFALAFAVFGWLARIQSFIVALIIGLVVIVLSRVILMNS